MVSDPGSRNGSDHRRPGAPTRGDRSHMKPHDQPARLLSNHLLRHALCCGPGCRGFESPRSPHAIQGLTCRFEGSPEFVANQMVSILVKQACVTWIKCSLVARSRPLRATYATRWSFISRAWLVLARWARLPRTGQVRRRFAATQRHLGTGNRAAIRRAAWPRNLPPPVRGTGRS